MENDKRIRVRILKRDGQLLPGQVKNLPAPDARRLIDTGKAEATAEPGETKPYGPSETKPLEPHEIKRSKKKRISADSES